MTATPPKKSKTGLIVLVVVLGLLLLACLIGVLAVIAIPAFTRYMSRAKSAEAEAQLGSLFYGVSSYYEMERFGPDGAPLSRCTVASERTNNEPGSARTLVDTAPGSSFETIGFSPVEPLYFQYEIVSAGGCGHPEGTALYTLRAYGDLDGDGVQSTYEYAVRSGPSGTLERDPNLRITNEGE
jgi:Tfp pilus assembly protein PilE